jgi:hypothetical protein
LCQKGFLSEDQLKKHVDIKHLNRADEYKKECGICHARVQQVSLPYLLVQQANLPFQVLAEKSAMSGFSN